MVGCVVRGKEKREYVDKRRQQSYIRKRKKIKNLTLWNAKTESVKRVLLETQKRTKYKENLVGGTYPIERAAALRRQPSAKQQPSIPIFVCVPQEVKDLIKKGHKHMRKGYKG